MTLTLLCPCCNAAHKPAADGTWREIEIATWDSTSDSGESQSKAVLSGVCESCEEKVLKALVQLMESFESGGENR